MPQILIHGLRDSVVPPAMSEAYATRARQAGDDARFIALPEVDHRDVIDPRRGAWEHVADQLEVTFAG